MPEFLVNRVLFLHSPLVLLPRNARLYAKLVSGCGECLNSLLTEYWICIRLQFCTLRCQKTSELFLYRFCISI